MKQIYKYLFILIFCGSSSLFAGDRGKEFDTLRAPVQKAVQQVLRSPVEGGEEDNSGLLERLESGLPRFSYSFGGSPPDVVNFTDLELTLSQMMPPSPSVPENTMLSREQGLPKFTGSFGNGLPATGAFSSVELTGNLTFSPRPVIREKEDEVLSSLQVVAEITGSLISTEGSEAGSCGGRGSVEKVPPILAAESALEDPSVNVRLISDAMSLPRDTFAAGAAVLAIADLSITPEAQRTAAEVFSTLDASSLFVSPLQVANPMKEEVVDPMEEWSKGVPAIYLDLFWATGVTRHPELWPSDARVLIGGKEIYANSFVPKMCDFLTRMPQKLIVTLVCDKLTYRSNEASLQKLADEFKDRFVIRFINDVLSNIKTVHPSYERTLEVLLGNGEWGNPAIASDAFRLLLRSIHIDASEGAALVYSDVDLFCAHNPPLSLPTSDETALERATREGNNESSQKKRSVYAENICNPERVGHKRRVNDLVKFIKIRGDEAKDIRVLSHFKARLEGPDPIIATHCPMLLNYFQMYGAADVEARPGIFEEYVRYAEAHAFNIRDDIINATGPGLLEFLGGEDLVPRLEYEAEYAASWFDVRSAIPNSYVFTLMPNVHLYRFVEEFVERTLRTSPKMLSLKPEQNKDPISLVKETEVLSMRHSFSPLVGFFGQFRDFCEGEYGAAIKAIHSALRTKYNHHRAMLSDFGWLKRFGESHPFYHALRTYLMQFFDLRRNADLQGLLHIYHKYDLSHPEIKAYTTEEWRELIFLQMQMKNLPYFSRDLLDIFQTVSESFGLLPLTQSDIQRMVEGF